MAVEAKPLYEAEAKKRQVEHGNTAPGKPKTLQQKVAEVLPEQPKPKPIDQSRAQAAKDFGTNHRYVNQAQKVKEQAPDVFEKLKRGKVTMQDAMKEATQAENLLIVKMASNKNRNQRGIK